jgi:hypothetical protein
MTTLFVVGTGRCGTYSIYTAFGQMGYDAHHEKHAPATIPTAHHFATGQRDPDFCQAILQSLSFGQVEADYKFSELVPLLALDDRTRFLWIRRRREDTIRSMVRRGWYRPEDDMGGDVMSWQWVIKPDGTVGTALNPNTAGNRTTGWQVGAMSYPYWWRTSQHDKCGWWVDYVDTLLEQTLPEGRSYVFDIETVTPTDLRNVAVDVFGGTPPLLTETPKTVVERWEKS